jgi:hypothetical protein
MNLPAHLGALIPSTVLAAVPFLGGEDDGGTRTLLGALVTLVAIAIVISIGAAMSRART